MGRRRRHRARRRPRHRMGDPRGDLRGRAGHRHLHAGRQRPPAVTAPTNDELREAMAAVAEQRDPSTLAALFGALAQSVLLVPVRQEDGTPVANSEGVEIAVERPRDGAPTYHAFTDLRALGAAAGASGAYVPMAAPALARVVLEEPDATLVVNAAGPHGGRLRRRDLEMVAQGVPPPEPGPGR